MKLGIGTVQFGLDYGISNKDGRTSLSEVKKILSVAAKRGLSLLDTAAQYGNSEALIGLCLSANHPFRIVTKTPSFRTGLLIGDAAPLLKETLFTSLRNLRQKSIYGLLIHDAEDILSDKGFVLCQAMQELKGAGFVEKIGVSVYSPCQLDAVLRFFQPDIVQLPVNVLDQRMIRSGHLQMLKDRGIEIHARSVFLQGLLLMAPAVLPVHFSPIRELLQDYRELLNVHRVTPVEAAISFVRDIPELDVVIVGVNNSDQLQELCKAVGPDSEKPRVDFSAFALDDEMIVNPVNWQ